MTADVYAQPHEVTKLKKLKDDIYDPVTGVLATIQRSERHHAARKQVGGRE